MIHPQLQYHEMIKGMTKQDRWRLGRLTMAEMRNAKDCTSCTQNDISNIARLELSYCMGCTVVPNYIPAEQIRQYIKEKYYGNNTD